MRKVALILLSLLVFCGCEKNRNEQETRTVVVVTGSSGSLLKNDAADMGYYLYLPSGANDEKGSAKWPLLVYLHGLGFVSDEMTLPLFTDSPIFLSTIKTDTADGRLENMPGVLQNCIILFPHSRQPEWAVNVVKKKITEVCAEYPVDQQRITMTGVSIGGIGTWQFAASYPELLASVVPVCGVCNRDELGLRLQDLASWTFHAVDDIEVVLSPEYFRFMDNLTPSLTDSLESILLKEKVLVSSLAGGTREYRKLEAGEGVMDYRHVFTLYPNGGHAIANRAYAMAGLWEWVLAQKSIED